MPYRLDRNRNGRRVIVYVREDIPSKALRKIYFRMTEKRYLLKQTSGKVSGYFAVFITLHHSLIITILITLTLDVYCQSEKVVSVGDFNAQIVQKCFDDFLFQHELKSVNDKSTCYKNPDKPSCIDIILTNSPLSFYKSDCLFIGLSDCHKLVLSVFKTTFSKSKPKEIIYTNFKKFNEEDFNQEFRGKLSTELVENYSSFENVCMDVCMYKSQPCT